MIDTRHGVFGVGSHLVAIHTSDLQEMFVLPEVRRPPGVPAHQRGVVALRGAVLPAVDLRVCLGFVSASRELDELVALLEAREQDHRNWLAELDRSVSEGRAFGLATDPRKCKFGQWFYAFQTDDPVLRGELSRFEAPHAAIHQLAVEVGALREAGRAAEAHQLVGQARDGLLSELVGLFQRTRQVVRQQHKEIGVCAQLGRRRVVLIVDRADAVTELQPFSEGDDPVKAGILRPDLVSSLGSWKGASQPVLILDLMRLAALA